MEGVESKLLQISPEISICLAENVEGFQQCIKEILTLIEQDGNFSEMTAESYDHKKSELKTHVTELSRMHAFLAEEHVNLIKKQNLQSSDSSSPQITQMFTPDQMSNTQKFRTPIGFDVTSSAGGVSYNSRIEGSESSFSLSSDSDSESFMSINKLLISPVNDEQLKVKETKSLDVLLTKISNLEEELVNLNKKLQNLEEENTNLKHEIQGNESNIESQNTVLETEKTKVISLEKQVNDLKLLITDSNLKIKTMGEELESSNDKLLAAEEKISNFFEQTHCLQSQLGSTQQEIGLLQQQLDSEKDKNLGLQEEVYSYVADISIRDDQITELATKIDHFMSEISLLKMEVSEKSQSNENLNKKLDKLMLEKDGIKAQLDTIQAEKCHQSNIIQELETRLNSLQSEHARVVSSFDNAQKVTNELALKVVDLEEEVVRQKEVILDRAEEKREAIRQLSFSLEHYMTGYKQLCKAFVGNKRRAVLTS